MKPVDASETFLAMRDRAKAAEQRVRELAAQVSALREALVDLVAVWGVGCHSPPIRECGVCRARAVLRGAE